jgi:hypothetical protein
LPYPEFMNLRALALEWHVPPPWMKYLFSPEDIEQERLIRNALAAAER